MSESKITKGDWEMTTEHEGGIGSPIKKISVTAWKERKKNERTGLRIATIDVYEGDDLEELKANAKLIAEAGTVTNETGKTPRQLADENKELLKAITIAEKYLYNADRELKSGKTLRQIVQEAIKKATE